MAKKKSVDMKNMDEKATDSNGAETIGIDTNKAGTRTGNAGNVIYSYDVQTSAKSSKASSRAFQVVLGLSTERTSLGRASKTGLVG